MRSESTVSNSGKTAFNTRFLSWFENWGSDLWTICHFASRHGDHSEEEFPEVLELTRRKSRTRLRKFTGEGAAGLFFKEWLALQKAKNLPSGLSAAEVGDRDRILVAAVFKTGWNFEKTALVFGISPGSVRYRTLHALKRIFQIPESTQRLSRDCVRTDLYLLDFLLGLQWKDPLHFFGTKDFEKHQSECARCRGFRVQVEDGLKQIRVISVPRLTEKAYETLVIGPDLASRWFLLSWISTWPWFLRVPLQLSLAAAIVFVVVSIPYVGEIFPQTKHYIPDVKSRLREATTHAPVAPEPAKEAPPPALVESVAAIPTPKVEEKAIPPAATPEPVAVAVQPDKPSRWRELLADAREKVKHWSERATAPPAPVPQVAPPPPLALPVLPGPADPPTPTEVVSVSPDAVLPPAHVSDEEKVATGTRGEPISVSTKKGTKLFYQWGAYTADLQNEGHKIIELLNKYGATPAGEYDFGDIYLGGRYYHFVIDEGAYEKLTYDLNQNVSLLDFTRVKATGIKFAPAGKVRVVFLLKQSPEE